MWFPVLSALCLVFPLRASPLPTNTLQWDPQLGNLLGIPDGLSQRESPYDLHDNGEDLGNGVNEDVMTDALAARDEQMLQDKLSGLRDILASYDENENEPRLERNGGWSLPTTKRGARVPRVERVHPRAMRNVLDAMPPELISHILQGHRDPPTPSAIEEFVPQESSLRGGGLSVGLDLDALSGMMAALRRQNYGERRKQTHRKLLNIGRK